MKNNALGFSLKVWLTAVLLGSAILALIINQPSLGTENSSFAQQTITIATMALLISSVLSIPSFAILLLSSWGLCNVTLTSLNRKFILTGVSMLLCLLAFFLMVQFYSITSGDFGLILPYFVTIVAGIWFYKLKTDKDGSVDNSVSI